MKRTLFLALIQFMCVQVLLAQSKWMFGPGYTSGLTSIMGKTNEHESGIMVAYKPQLGLGTGIKTEYRLSEKLGAFLTAGYMQRGAIIGETFSGSVHYRFSYLDGSLGITFRTWEIASKYRVFFSAAASQHTLLKAYREDSYSATNIKADLKRIDWGGVVTGGLEIPVRENDFLQVQLVFNPGITNLFAGVLEQNELKGRNLVYGVQLNYLLSKPSSNK
jgi:hypothetical protein